MGEFALLNPGPRSANLLARTPVKALELDGPQFERLRRSHRKATALRVSTCQVFGLIVLCCVVFVNTNV